MHEPSSKAFVAAVVLGVASTWPASSWAQAPAAPPGTPVPPSAEGGPPVEPEPLPAPVPDAEPVPAPSATSPGVAPTSDVPAEPMPETKGVHAPKYAFWLGVRPSFMTFGGNFYDNERNKLETTGNFIRNGLGLEFDIGARLAKRFVPYFAYERGFHAQGHRFAGSDASASSEFMGAGVRFLLGDPDSVSFLTDLGLGARTVTVSRGNETYSMDTIEYFRVGLGAEIRLSTRFVLSPMASLSSGTMSSSSGTIRYSTEGSGDGLTQPRYTEGQDITTARGYVVFALGCGVHFDLFGK
ncbi:MAG: hypothetical protein U0169_01225 [Polyangiaceae bacterium]